MNQRKTTTDIGRSNTECFVFIGKKLYSMVINSILVFELLHIFKVLSILSNQSDLLILHILLHYS